MHLFFSFLSLCQWFLVDIVPYTLALLSFITQQHQLTKTSHSSDETIAIDDISRDRVGRVVQNGLILRKLAIFLAMSTLLFAATLQPSFLSTIYFVVFLITMTAWALTCQRIESAFCTMCRIICGVLVIHISFLCAFQLLWMDYDHTSAFFR